MNSDIQECSRSISEPLEVAVGHFLVTIDYYPDSRSWIEYDFKTKEEADNFVQKFKENKQL